MMDEPRFAQPIPNVTVAGTAAMKSSSEYCESRIINFIFTVGRDANLPCVVEHLGTYKVISYFYCGNIKIPTITI